MAKRPTKVPPRDLSLPEVVELQKIGKTLTAVGCGTCGKGRMVLAVGCVFNPLTTMIEGPLFAACDGCGMFLPLPCLPPPAA